MKNFPWDEQNPRKARRDKRRVPSIRDQDIPPFDEIPVSDKLWYVRKGRERQIGREVCIAEGKHHLVRVSKGWEGFVDKLTRYTVWCDRCGEYAGYTVEKKP